MAKATTYKFKIIVHPIFIPDNNLKATAFAANPLRTFSRRGLHEVVDRWENMRFAARSPEGKGAEGPNHQKPMYKFSEGGKKVQKLISKLKQPSESMHFLGSR